MPLMCREGSIYIAPNTFAPLDFLNYVNVDDDKYAWRVNTRYYSATLHFNEATAIGGSTTPVHPDAVDAKLADEIQAIIWLVDAHSDESGASVRRWTEFVGEREQQLGVRLCVDCTESPSAVATSDSLNLLEEWCVDNSVELMTLDNSDGGVDDGNSSLFGDAFGFGRLRSALEANVWDEIERKKTARMMMGKGRTAAPIGGAGVERDKKDTGIVRAANLLPEHEQEIVMRVKNKVDGDTWARTASSFGSSVTSQRRQCASCQDWLEQPMRCAACKRAYYCTSACQREHWPQHKGDCKLLRRLPAATDATLEANGGSDELSDAALSMSELSKLTDEMLSAYAPNELQRGQMDTSELNDDEAAVERQTQQWEEAAVNLVELSKQARSLSREQRHAVADQFATKLMAIVGDEEGSSEER